jgi:prepilin-type N-terminal cleavage/methylation domain-containing protein
MRNLEIVDGFTLIEVLIALIILTFGVISFSTLQGRNATHNRKSETISMMTMIADSELEKVINLSYADCLNYNSSVVMDGKTYIINCNVNENATFSYKDVIMNVIVDNMNASFEYVKTKNYE